MAIGSIFSTHFDGKKHKISMVVPAKKCQNRPFLQFHKIVLDTTQMKKRR